jgi:hypothetical protein
VIVPAGELMSEIISEDEAASSFPPGKQNEI